MGFHIGIEHHLAIACPHCKTVGHKEGCLLARLQELQSASFGHAEGSLIHQEIAEIEKKIKTVERRRENYHLKKQRRS